MVLPYLEYFKALCRCCRKKGVPSTKVVAEFEELDQD